MNNESRELSTARIALAGFLSLAVAMGIGRFAFTPMLPFMLGEQRVDVAAGGWLAASNYAGYLVGALTASRLRMDARVLGAASLALVIALTAGMALPLPGVGWLALRFAAGLASAWAFVATSVWCLAALAQRAAAALSGVVYAGVGAGIAVAGIWCWVGGAMAAPSPALWLQLGGLAIVLSAPVVVVMRRLRGNAGPPAASASSPPAVSPGRAGASTGLIVCYGVLGFGYILPATFLPVLARSVVPDARWFGLAWPVFGLMAAASTVVAGRLMRSATRLQIWAVSHVLMAVGVFVPSIRQGGAAIAISALLVGGTFMVITMVGVQEVRARACGDPTALVARLTAAFAFGQIAGPVASSLLVNAGTGELRGLHLALQAAGLALIATAAWIWREDRMHRRHTEMIHAP